MKVGLVCLLLLCLSAKGRKFLGVNKPAAACVDVVNAFRENPTCIQECLWRWTPFLSHRVEDDMSRIPSCLFPAKLPSLLENEEESWQKLTKSHNLRAKFFLNLQRHTYSQCLKIDQKCLICPPNNNQLSRPKWRLNLKLRSQCCKMRLFWDIFKHCEILK